MSEASKPSQKKKMKTNTLPTIIRDTLRQHVLPMAAAAISRDPAVATRVKGGIAMMVADYGRSNDAAKAGGAYADYLAVHPEYAGQTLVVIEWYRMESYSSDPLSSGPAVTLLRPDMDRPICQCLMTLDEARAVVEAK